MLKVAAFDIIPVVLIQTTSGALHGLGKTNAPIIAFATGGIIKLILNLLLLPVIGIHGAIFATIISHFISLLICFIFLKKTIKYIFNLKKLLILTEKKG